MLVLIKEISGACRASVACDDAYPDSNLNDQYVFRTFLNIEVLPVCMVFDFQGIFCAKLEWLHILASLFCKTLVPEAFFLQCLHNNCVVSLIVALQTVQALLKPCLAIPQFLYLLQ